METHVGLIMPSRFRPGRAAHSRGTVLVLLVIEENGVWRLHVRRNFFQNGGGQAATRRETSAKSQGDRAASARRAVGKLRSPCGRNEQKGGSFSRLWRQVDPGQAGLFSERGKCGLKNGSNGPSAEFPERARESASMRVSGRIP